MTALEERLSKTEYIYVLGFDGKPQMPTRRKRHVLKLLKTGRARIAEDIPFTIRLTYRNAPVLQPVTLAEDPGRTNIGAAVLSPLGDLLFASVIETRNKEIKKLMTDRQKKPAGIQERGKKSPPAPCKKIWFHGEVRHGHTETAHVCCGQICDL